MNLKRLVPLGAAIFLLLACDKSPTVVATVSSVEKINFAEAASIVPTYDFASKTLKIEIALVDGVHAYAPGESIGKPVSLVVTNQGGWKVSGDVEIPHGTQRTLGSAQSSVVLEGRFTLKAKVEGGSGPIAAEVGLQVCSNDACDRPRIHRFQIEAPKGKLP